MTRDKHSETEAAQGASSSSQGSNPFHPFANDSVALTVGGLTIENGTDRVSISGSIDLALNKRGLEQARELKTAINAIVDALEKKGDLPETSADQNAPTKRVRNPFG
ncbi:hypothetical protein [Aureimonas sp. D3]|uniref:hypothetical protein n=1 Tax=Aureimonas sp. D3 TaxID=1638164 RepID=UPI000A77F9EF|nr:hypothetical protein [Aureimonas sp. D3]